ncbi:hypothetical protein FHS31_000802 [Sphingomonas vulcanisoli]|uniref:Antirepressor protein ant N-terminal domain-containing protein n=1 Tax=Sphingomonas vulcanisoli TaxID=1658060 RepID=A0ABX0TP63_9SPHN|nr:phage antirepressor N-terminal domain-containing protein [Sphingomonas vulcanisoli]NIJ07206.1 hypothetical protein [Sphingomonas vulcanisoli]
MTALATATRLQAVPFHDREILAARVGDQVRVPMKRFCGSIGLPWDGQRQRIERNPILKEGASVMLVPSEGGEQSQIFLPLGLLAGFLVGVSTARLKPDVAARLTLFQREAYDVLFQHFFGRAQQLQPVVARPPVMPGWQELEAARHHAPALINVITAETRPTVRRYLHQLLVADADRLGLAAPRLNDLGADAPSADGAIARLVRGLELLTSRKAKWNHLGRARANGRMALVLPELGRMFARHDIDVQVDDALRGALAAGNRTYQVTEDVIWSAIARKRVLATMLSPWPVEGGLG